MKIPDAAVFSVFVPPIQPHPLEPAFALVNATFQRKETRQPVTVEVARVDGWSIDLPDLAAQAEEIAKTRPQERIGVVRSRLYERGYREFMEFPSRGG